MFTTYADFMSDSVPFPAGQDDGSDIDATLLDRVIPLRTDADGAPTLCFGGAVLNSKNAGACSGRWQLHLFSFAAEARQAKQTISLLVPATVCSASARPNGEGLMLVREADGPFECRIVDRRKAKGGADPVGSWTLSPAIARRAALHVSPRPEGRAEAAAEMLSVEFDDPEESAALQERFGAAPAGRCIGRIRPQDVISAANRMLEPLGTELACSDRQIMAAIDAHLAAMRPDLDGMVDRIAHEIVAELAGSGCIG